MVTSGKGSLSGSQPSMLEKVQLNLQNNHKDKEKEIRW